MLWPHASLVVDDNDDKDDKDVGPGRCREGQEEEAPVGPAGSQRVGCASSLNTRRVLAGLGCNVFGMRSGCAPTCLKMCAKTRSATGRRSWTRSGPRLGDARGRPQTLSALSLSLLTDVARELCDAGLLECWMKAIAL